jgi:glucose repression regulatory protein TUP1
MRLRQELEARGGPPIAGPTSGHPSHPPPPSVGHGPNNLFGQIMTGGGGQGPGLAPPPPEPAQPQGIGAHLAQGGPPVGGPGAGPPGPPNFGGYGGPTNGMRLH